MEKQQALLCPSSRCDDGVLVLGIVLADQTIAYADRRLRVDKEMAHHMKSNETAPEKRFRFASSCVTSNCQQWSGGKCGVIEEAVTVIKQASLEAAIPTPSLPACSIRAQCRWFAQRGVEACHVCPLIVTDTTAQAPETEMRLAT